jgi:UDP-N-acetylglucosamine--N-acetylmuramyl-(pentapeptide) pyrophosphoryl-undecaprenol N-acetylglucosamine transferase
MKNASSNAPLTLLVAGGGTGGHIFPALEVARAWQRLGDEQGREHDVVFVGTARGLETRLVPAAGFSLELIRAAGLKGIGGWRFALNAVSLAPALWDSAAILRRRRPDVALGMGAYASGPVILAAVLAGIPSAIFEPNIEPGFTNRILGVMVARLATAFDITAQRWGSRAVATGCPVRAEFFEIAQKEHRPPFHILITGGSQGAAPVNQAVIGALPLLNSWRERLFLVHQAGERDYNSVRDAYAQQNFSAEVTPFIQNMAERFAQADLIVCRAGAITAAEVAASGRAAIFIPFGAAADSHQLRNAEWLEQEGAARLVPQNLLTSERLVREISSLMDDPRKLQEIERRVRTLARPRAAERIAGLLGGMARP